MLTAMFVSGSLFLALIFLWSGAVKLRHPGLAAAAILDFGVVRTARPMLGHALGAFEVLWGLLLIVAVWRGGGVSAVVLAGAAALLWLFAALIAHAIRAGRAFACFCFGDSASQLSSRTLGRTAALAVCASALAATAPMQDSVGAHEIGLGLASAAATLGVIALVAAVLAGLVEVGASRASSAQAEQEVA